MLKARSFPRIDRSYEIVDDAVIERVWFGIYPSHNRISLAGCTIHTDNGLIRRNVRIAGNNNEMVCRDLLLSYNFPKALESATAFARRSNETPIQDINLIKYADFYKACESAELRTVAAYIRQGGDVNEWKSKKERNLHGYRVYKVSPLHAAAGHGNIYGEREDVVSALISAGASVHEIDENDVTPLGYACLTDRAEVAKILLGAGANPNHRPVPPRNNFVQDDTPLAIAAASNATKVIPILVSFGADPNIEGAKNMPASGTGTPLQIAVFNHHKEAVIALLECGADPNIDGANMDGKTPLSIARSRKNTVLAEILVRAGAV